ncbi:MAG TPA: CDGSH iron-sulfur domain-containing protein [Xanthomonadaceae bacterium]|nr:CDGSH iron-sulfur domain-containing protein [Xanthomonadaceae bacterium]
MSTDQPTAAAPSDDPVQVEVAHGKDVTVQFEARRCIHSRFCVLGQPGVFRANTAGEWIFPDAASAEDLALVAQECPSGAITYTRNDGGPNEPLPQVNVLRIRENGPLAFVADLRIEGQAAPRDHQRIRATLCRCGASQRKPFCDGSHIEAKFVASGEAPSKESQPLAARDGVLTVSPQKDGPLQVEGNLEICCGTGRTIDRVQKTWLCRCGNSQNKPFCDGTHRKVGFKAD